MFILEYVTGTGSTQFVRGPHAAALKATVRHQHPGQAVSFSSPIREDRLHLFPDVQARLRAR